MDLYWVGPLLRENYGWFTFIYGAPLIGSRYLHLSAVGNNRIYQAPFSTHWMNGRLSSTGCSLSGGRLNENFGRRSSSRKFVKTICKMEQTSRHFGSYISPEIATAKLSWAAIAVTVRKLFSWVWAFITVIPYCQKVMLFKTNVKCTVLLMLQAAAWRSAVQIH